MAALLAINTQFYEEECFENLMNLVPDVYDASFIAKAKLAIWILAE